MGIFKAQRILYVNTMTRRSDQTSAPLPGAKRADKRAEALRGNLGKRKAQTRKRENSSKEKT
jgi:hypothetical protein